MSHPVPGPQSGSISPAPSTDVEEQQAQIDSALALLVGLEQRPVAEHVDIFTDVHGRLQHALTEIDSPGR